MGKKVNRAGSSKGAALLKEGDAGSELRREQSRDAIDRLRTVERSVPVQPLISQLKKKSLSQGDWFDMSYWLIFIGMYLIIFSYQIDTEKQFFLEASISNAIVDEEWSEVPLKTYYDINDIDDWYKWFNTVLVDKVYADWSTNSQGAFAYLAKMNMIIAGIEVTQYRSKQVSCSSKRYADVYRTPCESDVLQVGNSGIFHYSRIYEGYTEFFPISDTQAVVLEKSQKLQNETWLNPGTRGVTTTLNLYNANLNMLALVRMELEIKTSGYFDKRVRISSVDIEPYVATSNNSRFYIDFAFAVLVGINVLKTFLEFFVSWRTHRNCSSFFKSGWVYFDVLLMSLFIAIMVWWFTFVGIVSVLDIPATHNDSAEMGWEAAKSLMQPMEDIYNFSTYYMTLNAVTVVLASIRFFGFFRYWGKMSVITVTISESAGDLAHFVFFFFVIFGAFAYIGNLLFGRYLEGYSSILAAVQSCFNMTLGDFDYEAMRKVEPIGAPIFFWSIIIVVGFTLINMFIAIVSDMYSKVQADRDFQQNILSQVWDMVMSWHYTFGDIFRRIAGKKRLHPSTKVLTKIAEELASMGLEHAEESDIINVTPSQYDGRMVAKLLIDQFGVTIKVERTAAHLRQTKSKAQQQLDNVNSLLQEVIDSK